MNVSDRGQPIATVEAKRVLDKVSVSVDWHDYLIVQRAPGRFAALNLVFRPPRFRSTGFQYRCTKAGFTSSKPFEELRWGKIAGSSTNDGTAIWTAEEISSQSLRNTVNSDSWSAADGLVISNFSNDDLIYTTYVAGGTNGQTYELRHAINLSAAEESKEALVLLPVRD